MTYWASICKRLNFFVQEWIGIFIVMLIMVFPFSYDFFKVHTVIIQRVLEQPIQWLKVELLHWDKPYARLESDSSSLYVLLLLITSVSLLIAIWILFKRKSISEINKFRYWQKEFSVYFLALILIKYGLSKIFGGQFYEPEPNIMFTEFGLLDKDILYWSTMGRSYSYNLFLGLIELIVGVGLIIKRTRFLALLISLFVLVNILAVNLSFDISVKILSAFLVVVNLYLVIPQLLKIFKAYKNRDLNSLVKRKKEKTSMFRITIRTIIIIAIAIESLAPHYDNGFQFDWQLQKSDFHGAYKFQRSSVNESFLNVDYLFIHRANYFILKKDNEFSDFHFIEYDDKIVLEDYNANQKEFQIELNKGKLRITKDKEVYLFSKIDLNQMYAKDAQFKFTVD